MQFSLGQAVFIWSGDIHQFRRSSSVRGPSLCQVVIRQSSSGQAVLSGQTIIIGSESHQAGFITLVGLHQVRQSSSDHAVLIGSGRRQVIFIRTGGCQAVFIKSGGHH